VAFGQGSIDKQTRMTTGGHLPSRIGFRGVEDLGGGLSASFWLEAGILTDSGAGLGTNTNNQASGETGSSGMTFNRRSTLSLSGGFGEIRMGRDFTPQSLNGAVFDPFLQAGVGGGQPVYGYITGPTKYRASNSIAYLTPRNLGGFYAHAMHYLGENSQDGAATQKDGTGTGLRAGYVSGPLEASVAVSGTKYAAGNVQQNNVGGSWDFGFVKVMGLIESDKNGLTKARGLQIGGKFPISTGEVRLAYSRYTIAAPGKADQPTDKLALGYVHNLSKRTSLYGTVAHLTNKGGASFALNGAKTAPNGSSTGLDLGLITRF
jgi:predicted porin